MEVGDYVYLKVRVIAVDDTLVMIEPKGVSMYVWQLKSDIKEIEECSD